GRLPLLGKSLQFDVSGTAIGLGKQIPVQLRVERLEQLARQSALMGALEVVQRLPQHRDVGLLVELGTTGRLGGVPDVANAWAPVVTSLVPALSALTPLRALACPAALAGPGTLQFALPRLAGRHLYLLGQT